MGTFKYQTISVYFQVTSTVGVYCVWAEKPCGLVGGYQRFEGNYRFHLQVYHGHNDRAAKKTRNFGVGSRILRFWEEEGCYNSAVSVRTFHV
jgi:hypothetical protein